MATFLDGKSIPCESHKPDLTVGALIELTKPDLPHADTIICAVCCDGQEVAAEHLDEVLSQPVANYDRLELISGNLREIVLDALNHTRRSLADSAAMLKQSADDMTAGNVTEGMSRLNDCVKVWGQVHEAIVRSGALTETPFEQIIVEGKTILDWLRDIATRLGQLKKAIESRDVVLLGDLLHYELDDAIDGWENMLNGYIGHFEQPSGTIAQTSNAQTPLV